MSKELEKNNYDLFLQYLKSLNLNSAEKYAKGLQRWSEELADAGILEKGIFEYENSEEFIAIEEKIKFINMNHRKNENI